MKYINYMNNKKNIRKLGLKDLKQGFRVQRHSIRNGNKNRNIKLVTSQEQNERTKNQEHKSYNMKQGSTKEGTGLLSKEQKK